MSLDLLLVHKDRDGRELVRGPFHRPFLRRLEGQAELHCLLPVHILDGHVRGCTLRGPLHQPEQTSGVVVLVDGPSMCDGGPGPAIQGEGGAQGVLPTAILGDAHDRVLRVDELLDCEGPCCPELGLPGPLVVLPVADHEVLVRVGGQGLVEGLEDHCDPTFEPEDLVQVVAVSEEPVPIPLGPDPGW
eukprot:13216566-Heterocapsa_arctica.AAC.1